MEDLLSFGSYVTINTTGTLLSFLIPLTIKWYLAELAKVENPPVLSALQLIEYQIS